MKYDDDKKVFANILSKYTKIGTTVILDFLEKNNVNDIFQNPQLLTNDMSKIKRVEELKFLRNTYDNLKDYSSGYKIDSPQKARNYFLNFNMDIQDKEYFSVAFLNTKNEIIDTKTTSGTINYAVVDVRGVIKDALLYNATGIIISHNHPSGNPEPSKEDVGLTKRFVDSCDFLGINFLDHVITSNLSYVSMKERYGDFNNAFFGSVKENQSLYETVNNSDVVDNEVVIEEKPVERSNLMGNTFFKAHANPSRVNDESKAFFVQAYERIEGTAEALIGDVVYYGTADTCYKLVEKLNNGEIGIADISKSVDSISSLKQDSLIKNLATLDFVEGVERIPVQSTLFNTFLSNHSDYEVTTATASAQYLQYWDMANTSDSFAPKMAVLQLSEIGENRDRKFLSLDDLKSLLNEVPNAENYEVVFIEKQSDMPTLDDVYSRFNSNSPRPSNYYGHSLSMGDVVVLANDSMDFNSAFYVNDIGFEKIPDFLNHKIMSKIANNIDLKAEYNLLSNLNDSNLLTADYQVRLNGITENYAPVFTLADKRNVLEKANKLNAIFSYEANNGGEDNSENITYFDSTLDKIMIKADVFRNNSAEELNAIVDSKFEVAQNELAYIFVPNNEQMKGLNALYSAVLTGTKYKDDENVQSDISDKFKSYAENLDALGVPFSVQNSVARAGEIPQNWDRYNETVINEVIDSINNNKRMQQNSRGVKVGDSKDLEQGYKLFYAGSGGQDNDASLNYGLTFTQHYDEAQLIEEFGESHEHSLSDTTDILFDSADERSQFVSELANDSKGIENFSSWESWSNSPSDSDKFNVSSISLADLQNDVSILDDKPLSTVESNFSISRTQHNTFVVRSDSERFGKNAITFESYNRNECVDYISSRSEQIKPSYYVIEDLSTWANNAPVQSVLERFDTLGEAINKFNEYRSNPYDYSDGKAKLTMGVSVGMSELDIIQVRNDENYLVSDFTASPNININKAFLVDLNTLSNTIGFDKIRLYRDEYGNKYNQPLDLEYSAWENPYRVDDLNSTSAKTVAIESTEGFSDTIFHSELIDADVMNDDGSYGKVKEFYRLVELGDDGLLKPYPNANTMFDDFSSARNYVLNNNLTEINYDEMVHQASDKRINDTLSNVSNSITHGEEIYKYYAVMRPISLGTHPREGMIDFKHYDDKQYVEEIGREAWSEIFYNRSLTEQELNDFELIAEPPKRQIQGEEIWSNQNNSVKVYSLENGKFGLSISYGRPLPMIEYDTIDKVVEHLDSEFGISTADRAILESVSMKGEKKNKEGSSAEMTNDDKKTDNLIQDDSEMSARDLVKEQLENGIRDVMESDKFKDWCATGGKLYFNNYSFNNAMLTYIQKPESSYVMGYEAWKGFGRQVKKGANGIKIFTPSFAKEYKKGGLYSMIRKNLQEILKKDPSLPYAVYRLGQSKLSFTMQHNGMMGLMINGRDVQRFNSEEDCRKFIDRQVLGKVPMYYSVGTVFDVSDTYEPEHIWLKNGYKKEDLVLNDNGKPIKNRRGEFQVLNTDERKSKFVTDLDLSIPEADTEKMNTLFSVLQKVSENKGVPMTVEAISEEGVKGFYERSRDGGNGRIAIREGLSPTEMVATALHEMAHADMHRDLQSLSAELGEKVDRGMREVQAEAVAFMTASNFGIETETSSFTYLAVWSKGKELADLHKSLDVIYKESKALMKSIEKELDLRGLDLHIESKNQEPLGAETLNETVKEFTAYFLDKSNEYDDISKDIVRDLKEVLDEEEINVIKNQGLVVKEIKNQLADMGALKDELLNTSNRKAQVDIIEKLNALKTRIWQSENQFNVLTDRRISIVDINKNTLKKQFDTNPLSVLKDLQKQFSEMQNLTEKDLSYLSKSKFLTREYSKFLRDNPKEFVTHALKQVENIGKVQSKNGSFVEIEFCEHWGENVIFEKGTVAHPKLANRVIEEAEKEIRNLKVVAEKSGEYYPYNKCSLVLYTPNADGGYNALHTRVDIGDGYQKNLTDHLEQACDKNMSAVLDSYKDTLAERPKITEKLISPSVEPVIENPSIDSKGSDKENKLSVDEWKSEINKIRGDASDSNDSPKVQKEKESERD